MSKLIKCKTCTTEMASSATTCPKCGAKNKQPIYKKWWFYVVIILIIGALAGTTEDTPSSDTTNKPNTENPAITPGNTTATTTPALTPEPEDKNPAIKAGTYKIGTELPAGEYLFIADSMGYMEITSDSTGSFDSIIANDTVASHRYITVKDCEYLKLQGGKAYALTDAPSIVPENGLYQDGMYKVGTDIPAGEYKVVLTSSIGYIEVTSGSRGVFDEIVTNDVPTGDTYITVTEGQYLKLQGVEIQK